jgi:hypothetical protein
MTDYLQKDLEGNGSGLVEVQLWHPHGRPDKKPVKVCDSPRNAMCPVF